MTRDKKRITLLLRTHESNNNYVFMKHTEIGIDRADGNIKWRDFTSKHSKSKCKSYDIKFDKSTPGEISYFVCDFYNNKGIVLFTKTLNRKYDNVDQAYIWRDAHQEWMKLS